MKKVRKLISYIIMVLIPVVIFYLMEFMLRNPFKKMYPQIQALNIVFFELLFLFLFVLFGKAKIALRIEAILAMIVGLADYFIISFRSIPIMPWDILSIRTAASVANNYEYRLTGTTVLILILFLLVIIFSGKIGVTLKAKFPVRIGMIAVGVALLFGYTKYVQKDETVRTYRLYDKLFTPTTMTYKDGTVVAFIMEAKFMNVEKPAGYSNSKAEELLSGYEQPVKMPQTLPNIIVIMDEAFSDLSILGDYQTNVDEIPYMRQMLSGMENTVSGHMDVSVLGGNTANTEFEFLTGDSMAFLPQGSIPYQQFVKKQTDSLAWNLKELGYETVAMHPYKATGWSRDKVYEYFGFDSFYSEAVFSNPQIIRKYISDQADFDKIKEVYEEKPKGTPLFLFNVTMQNHSSYTDVFDNFTPDVSVEGTESIALNQYLSLLKRSDEALQDLIEYFDAQAEPTIIVFFGDHQPTDSVVAPIYTLHNKKVSNLTEEELRLRYKVPYIIHANFDILMETNADTSANFLGGKVLDVAGITKNAYRSFLLDTQKTFPSISAMQAKKADGTITDVKSVKDEIHDYQMLQYYHLFQ